MAASSSYLIKSQARCLVAHTADEDSHGFLVGTANLRGPNEIRLLRYHEEEDDIECAAIYHHQDEVLSMSACPTDAALVATVSNGRSGTSAAVWRMPDLPPASEDGVYVRSSDALGLPEMPAKDLVKVADIPAVPAGEGAGALRYTQWSPATEGSDRNTLVSLYDSAVRVWSLREDGSVAPSGVGSIASGDASFVGGMAWDPHHAAEIAVATDSSVSCWDLRTGERIRGVDQAVPSGLCVRGLSYNPNRPGYLATAGEDYKVKFWDVRKLSAPVKILSGHTHWVTSVAFNPFHDQLVASGGSDGRVALWRVSSISSAPLLELADEYEAEVAAEAGASGADSGADVGGGSGSRRKKNEPKLAPDAAIRVNEDHEDSVSSVAWSAHNAWVYASLSYTGRVVLSTVPSAEKYKILL